MNATPWTRYQVRWSTSPALVGYPRNNREREDAKARFRESEPDFTGTARQCIEYRAGVKRQLRGVFARWEFRRNDTGEVVPAAELEQIVSECDRRRAYA